MGCASNGTIELFMQPYSARSALCVLGSTPAADEARFLAERYRIRLAATPEEAPVVLVATQGQGDEAALEAALRSGAGTVLMIASRRKAERLRQIMRGRGIDETGWRGCRRGGADAGAQTPGEIALVAIVAPPFAARVPRPRRGLGPAPRRRVCRWRRLVRSKRRAASRGTGPFINPVCGMAVSIADAVHVEAA